MAARSLMDRSADITMTNTSRASRTDGLTAIVITDEEHGMAPATAVQTGSWDFDRALAAVRRMETVKIVATELDGHRPGPRRYLPWEAWFTAIALAVMHSRGKAHMTGALAVINGLTPTQRWQLGLRGLDITYAHVESGLETIIKACRPSVNVKTGQVRPPRLTLTEHDIANSLIRATHPPGMVLSDTIAMDSTDFETDAARRSRASLNVLGLAGEAIAGDSDKETPTEVVDGKVMRRSRHRTRGAQVRAFPYVGADKRLVHSLDEDARDGYRSGKQMKGKDTFLGYDLHIATSTPVKGSDARAALAYGIEVAPAGSSKARAGLNLIERLNRTFEEDGHRIAAVCVDRGYSMAKHENWALQLSKQGIVQHHDLGEKETRLAPADKPGIIFLDGHPYIANMPKRLKELRRPGLGATKEEKAAAARDYDERRAYAFSANGPAKLSPRDENGEGKATDGDQRYRGPVLTGKVRCPNHPRSMRWAEHKPLTNCDAGTKCACGATITVKAADPRAKHRQPELFGTSRWHEAYGARNMSESFNASVKKHHMSLQRHSARVFGLAKNTIMLGFIVAATNIAVLRTCYNHDDGKPEQLPPAGTPVEPQPAGELTVFNDDQPPRAGPQPSSEPPLEPKTNRTRPTRS